MNLIIDIGNSGTKIATFKNNERLALSRFDCITVEVLRDFIGEKKINKAIISSVRDIPEFVHDRLLNEADLLHILTSDSEFPFKIDYRTPETLGPDRLAAVAGAYSKTGGADSVVIDAGSAITFDLLENGVYKGGNISPGIEMRFRALNMLTGKLPLIRKRNEFTNPGTSTEDAIAAGVIMGVVYEINEYIRTFEERNKSLKVIITGGDGEFLAARLQKKVNHMPEIVIEGLNFILEYNAK